MRSAKAITRSFPPSATQLKEMTRDDGLEIWTVYYNPSDFPGKYVCRRTTIVGGGKLVFDPDALVVDDIAIIRREMMMRGLHQMPRFDGDDPVVVECWL